MVEIFFQPTDLKATILKNKKGVKHSLYLQARVCILGSVPLLICLQHYNNFSNPPIFSQKKSLTFLQGSL